MNLYGVVTIKLDRRIGSKVNAKLDSAPKPHNFLMRGDGLGSPFDLCTKD